MVNKILSAGFLSFSCDLNLLVKMNEEEHTEGDVDTENRK